MEEFRESEESHYASQNENHDNQHVPAEDTGCQFVHLLEYEVILAQNQENEAAGDSGKNHGTYGNGTADKDEPQALRGLSGRKGADSNSKHYAKCDEQDFL